MGKIICTGLGPGDPDLMSVKSDRLIRAARHVAYFRKAGRAGQARQIVQGMLAADAVEYASPVTTKATTAVRLLSSVRMIVLPRPGSTPPRQMPLQERTALRTTF